ncbi:MAG: hypothetical protein JSR80_01830 [Verrucomicrobia bacterium]|nr:hypothetical protein [Verrucomicrobiota bacterium]
MKKIVYFDPSAKKMKSRIYGTTAIILFLAMLLIDVANARGDTRHQAGALLIENIYLLVPWCLAYLLVARYRIFLKKFIPIYLCLALLVAAASQFVQNENIRINQKKRFNAEAVKIMQYSLNGQMADPTVQLPTSYSSEQYGKEAKALNHLKEMAELSQQEWIFVAQTFNAMHLDQIFSENFIFNLSEIIKKKREVQGFLKFLDESEKRMRKIHFHWIRKTLSSMRVENPLTTDVEAIYSKSVQEHGISFEKTLNMWRRFAQEHLGLLNALADAYGSYEIDENNDLVFLDFEDELNCNLHLKYIRKIRQESQDSELLAQQYISSLQQNGTGG